MAEALLKHWDRGRFSAHSAGSHPAGRVHPLAIETLVRHRVRVDGPRSKSWDEFATPGAPPIHFVFTVCDNAASETCPIWPGKPMTAHWGIQDPAAMTGTEEEQRRAFVRAFRELDARIRVFASLRLDALDRPALQARLDEIGRTRTSATGD